MITELDKHNFDSSKYIKMDTNVRRDLETERLVNKFSENINEEKEYLVYRYLKENKVKPDEICIVIKNTPDGNVIYIDLIKNHIDI